MAGLPTYFILLVLPSKLPITVCCLKPVGLGDTARGELYHSRLCIELLCYISETPHLHMVGAKLVGPGQVYRHCADHCMWACFEGSTCDRNYYNKPAVEPSDRGQKPGAGVARVGLDYVRL
jgi:hypothetical protein